MNILIVDGNEKKASDRYLSSNMKTQFKIYQDIIRELSDLDLNITTIHPACYDDFIPKGLNIDDFDGVAWTGSLLNIYDLTPPIKRQIELAKILLNKKNKIFGSCWGLQVLTTAAGGRVRKNPNGLEAIIAKDIKLNKNGIQHPMYKNKPEVFDSFCWHYDEVEILPPNSIVLSSNKKSEFQSISFTNKDSKVWAVQYHPEFNPEWMSGLMCQRKSVLLENKIYKTEKEFKNYRDYFSNVNKNNKYKDLLNISETLTNNKILKLELKNWLEYINNEL